MEEGCSKTFIIPWWQYYYIGNFNPLYFQQANFNEDYYINGKRSQRAQKGFFDAQEDFYYDPRLEKNNPYLNFYEEKESFEKIFINSSNFEEQPPPDDYSISKLKSAKQIFYSHEKNQQVYPLKNSQANNYHFSSFENQRRQSDSLQLIIQKDYILNFNFDQNWMEIEDNEINQQNQQKQMEFECFNQSNQIYQQYQQCQQQEQNIIDQSFEQDLKTSLSQKTNKQSQESCKQTQEKIVTNNQLNQTNSNQLNQNTNNIQNNSKSNHKNGSQNIDRAQAREFKNFNIKQLEQKVIISKQGKNEQRGRYGHNFDQDKASIFIMCHYIYQKLSYENQSQEIQKFYEKNVKFYLQSIQKLQKCKDPQKKKKNQLKIKNKQMALDAFKIYPKYPKIALLMLFKEGIFKKKRQEENKSLGKSVIQSIKKYQLQTEKTNQYFSQIYGQNEQSEKLYSKFVGNLNIGQLFNKEKFQKLLKDQQESQQMEIQE